LASIFHSIRSYITYRWRAQNAHDLHSPFLFTLYNEVIRKRDKTYESGIKSLRSRLLNLKGNIQFTDPKSGQKKQVNLRKFAKNSASSHQFSYFLVKLIDHLGYETVLETGTCTGVNTAYLITSKASKVITLEGSPEIAKIAQLNFDRFMMGKVKLEEGTVRERFETLLAETKPDLIFLDADHRSETIKFYLEAIKKIHPKVSCIIIHDIHWSADMEQAWERVIQNSDYNLTIDIFQAGIIFPDHPMEKQHFIVKF